MVLCWSKYKDKHILFLALGKSNGKVIGLKVQEHGGPELVSDKSIELLRNNVDKLMKMNLKKRLSAIKNLVSEWSKVYRTYNPEYLTILQRYPIGPS